MHEHSFPGRITKVTLLTCCFNELWALPVERPGSSEMDCWIPSANHTAKGMARRQKRHTGPWLHGPLTSKRVCWTVWMLSRPLLCSTADCFVKDGVSGEEQQVYAALLTHQQPSKTGESLLPSAWQKLQVGTGCRSHLNRDAAATGRSGRLERTGTLFAVGSKPQPSVRGDGKETLLQIQRVLGS